MLIILTARLIKILGDFNGNMQQYRRFSTEKH